MISKPFKIVGIFILITGISSWRIQQQEQKQYFEDSLRQLYERPIAEWPRPNIDSDVHYQEMAALPIDSSWLLLGKDVKVKLGQLLFCDPRLSSSNQISCSSCHDPDMAWMDGRRVSLGNDHLQGTRNTPSLYNLVAHKSYFWDGRAKNLEDQAMSPLAMHHEMNMQTAELPQKIESIEGYKTLFQEVYGKKPVTLSLILDALASFENIIKSRQSAFDRFVRGNYKAMTDQEIRGLDLFRGKARCMNCHYGTYFTDDDYHNIGLTYYKRKYEDLGRYEVTKKKEDIGRFRTPSLRDVMKTGPWMHNGLFDNILGVINLYNSGMHQLDNKNPNPSDTLYPHTDHLLKPLDLTMDERQDLVAFLNAITATQFKMRRPELPQ
ncbi:MULTISPECIES: cytochrome-c peroxidase [Chitinophagaceae]